MSRGSNNDDINMVFVERLVNAIGDLTQRIEEINTSLFQGDFFDKAMSKHMATYKSSNMTSADMEKFGKALAKDLENYLKVNYNVGMTQRGRSTVDTYFKEASAKYSGKDPSPFMDQMKTSIKNLYSSMTFESMRGAERGEKKSKLYLTNTLDNERLKDTYKEFAKKLGVKLDETQDKFMNFFKDEEKKKEKKMRGFIDELIEGLSRSRWIGGALHDTFRLIGFLGASWLSHFGKLGKTLGAAFYVAMDMFGPTFAKLLLKGIGKLLMSLPTILGAFGWGRAAGVTAGVLGAQWAYGEAQDSAKKGKKGNAFAFKAGGTGMAIGGATLGVAGAASLGATTATAAGATGLAGALTAIATAITPWGAAILAIGGAVAGLSFLWKKYHKDSSDQRRKSLDEAKKSRENAEKYYGNSRKFMEKSFNFMDLWEPIAKVINTIKDWLGEHFGFLNKLGKVFVQFGRMKVSKRDGAILNLSELSQREASTALQAYENDPTYGKFFRNVFEWVPGNKASFGSHTTDAVKMVNGKVVGALSKKGTSREIDDLRALLIRGGMSSRKAAEFVQTSGKLTGSNTQHMVGGQISHNNSYGLAIDLAGGGSWTARDYYNNYDAIKKYYAARGFKVNLEKPGQGKSTGFHYDIKPMSNFRPAGAQKNMSVYNNAQGSAKATQTSIQLKSAEVALKGVDAEAYKKASSSLAAKLGNNETRLAIYKEELKKRGITEEKIGSTGETAYSRVNKSTKGREFAFSDPSGNITWLKTEFAVQHIQQFGAGR